MKFRDLVRINNLKINFNNFKREIIFIVLFAFFLRILFLLVLDPWNILEYINNFMSNDANDYYLKSINILESNSFNLFTGYRTPIYPLFIATIFQLFGVKIWIALIFQIGLDLINVYLVYLISQKIFINKKISVISAFLYSINMIIIVNILQIQPDIIFLVFFNLFILLLFKFYIKQSINIIIYMGFILGFSTLIRPITIYYPAIIFLIIFYINIDIKSKVKYCLTFLIIFLVTISPWQLYNLINNDHYQLTTMQTHQLRVYSERIKQYKHISNNGTDHLSPLRIDHFQKTDNQTNWGKSNKETIIYIISNLPIFMLLTLKGIINTFIGTAKADILKLYGYKFINPEKETLKMRFKRVYSNMGKEYYLSPLLLTKQLIEYISALFGIYYLYLKRKNKEIFTIFITILYFVFLPSMFGDTRYKIPIIPLYLAFSASGIYLLQNFFKEYLIKNTTH